MLSMKVSFLPVSLPLAVMDLELASFFMSFYSRDLLASKYLLSTWQPQMPYLLWWLTVENMPLMESMAHLQQFYIGNQPKQPLSSNIQTELRWMGASQGQVYQEQPPVNASIDEMMEQERWGRIRGTIRDTNMFDYQSRLRELDSKKRRDVVEYGALQFKLGVAFNKRKDYQRGFDCLGKSLVAREKGEGVVSKAYASTLTHLGNSCFMLKKWNETRRCYEAAIAAYRELNKGSDSEACAPLYHNIARLLKEEKNYEHSIAQARTSLALYQQTQGPDYLGCVMPLNHIGTCHNAQNHHKEGEEYFLRAVEIMRTNSQRDSCSYALLLDNLGNTQRKIGKTDEAIANLRESVEMYERRRALMNSDYAQALMNLAGAHQDKEEDQEAERLYEKAFTILEKRGGKDSKAYNEAVGQLAVRELKKMESIEKFDKREKKLSQTEGGNTIQHAKMLERIGEKYEKKQNYEFALKYYHRALEIAEEHPNSGKVFTGHVLNNIDMVESKEKRTDVARKYLMRSLSCCEQAAGSNSRHCVEPLSNLGQLQINLQDYKQALRHFQRAARIMERTQSEPDMTFAKIMNGMGLALAELGRNSEAIKCYQHSLQVKRDIDGPDTMQAYNTLSDMALVYEDLKDIRRAEECLGEVMRITEKNKGRKCYEYAEAAENLANIFSEAQEYPQAIKYYRRAYDVYNGLQGDRSDKCVKLMQEMGRVNEEAGNNEGALDNYQRSLALIEGIEGEESPSTIEVYESMARASDKLKRRQKARELRKKGQEIKERSQLLIPDQ